MDTRTYTRAEVDAILCVFDELSMATMTDNKSAPEYWRNHHGDFGTPGLRDAAIEIGPKVEAVWIELGGGVAFDVPFDFEVVPEFLRIAIARHGRHTLTHEQWLSAGRTAQANLADTPGAVPQ